MAAKKLNVDIQAKGKKTNPPKEEKKPKKKESIQQIQHLIQKGIHTFQNMSHQNLLIIFGSIVGALLLSVFWHIASRSNYIEFIPDITEQFVHINTEKTPENIAAKSLSLFHIDPFPFTAAKKADISSLTFIQFSNSFDVFFLSNISQGKAKTFLRSFTTDAEDLDFIKENGVPVIEVKQGKPLYCLYMERSLFCASQKSSVLSFLNTPKNEILIRKNALQNIEKSVEIVWYSKGESLPLPLFKAQKDAIKDVYVSWKINSDNNTIRTRAYAFTEQDLALSKKQKFIKNTLSSYFPQKTSFFISGYNFHDQWLHTEDFYMQSSPEYMLILKGILQKQVSNLFGVDTDFYKNILPLFQGIYAFGIVNDTKNIPQFVFASQGTSFATIENLMEKFYKNRGIFTVEKKTLKVDEKTTLESEYSNEKKMKKIEEREGNNRIFGYEIEGKAYGFFTTQKDDLLFISTSKEVLKNILKDNSPSLQKHIPHTLKNAYEFGFISLEELEKTFSFIPFDIPKIDILNFIQSLSWESESFPGGISLSGNIQLKNQNGNGN